MKILLNLYFKKKMTTLYHLRNKIWKRVHSLFWNIQLTYIWRKKINYILRFLPEV